MSNIILNTDSYKASHFLQYPPDTSYVSSYIESRGGEYDFTVFFGLQMFVKKYLLKPITTKDVDEAEEYFHAHGLPFNRAGWDYVVNTHGGLLPLKITAVKEGTVLPTRNVLVQVVNTDPKVPWLTSYMETALLRAIWYPTTVATRSKKIKNIIQSFIDKTSDDPAQIAFKLHDFGFRGVSSLESGSIGGAAHLVNFMGTDTVGGLVYARKYYGESMAGFSIPAAEHSTITSWGGPKNEVEAFANMINQFGGPGKLVAVVSDSYDIYSATEHLWGDILKNDVLATGGTVVVRPDSGDPTVVPIDVIKILDSKYGHTVNSKGYKVLNPAVRVIQGDGINENSIAKILENLEQAGYAVDNLAFGMGGELLQTMNRDTLKFAMKASAIKREGWFGWIDIQKNPSTQPDKASKKGVLGLVKVDGVYKTIPYMEANGSNLLETVYEDGKLMRNQTLAEIRGISNEK